MPGKELQFSYLSPSICFSAASNQWPYFGFIDTTGVTLYYNIHFQRQKMLQNRNITFMGVLSQ